MSKGRFGIASTILAAILTLVLVTPAFAVVTIVGSGTSWSPSKVSIHTGVKVRWHARTGNHTVKAYGGNWTFFRSLNQGTSVSHVFKHTGTFKFYCTIHGHLSNGVCSGMCGKVVVSS